MSDQYLKRFLNQEINIFVRFGFKKNVEETQSYQGILINVNTYGIILERKIKDEGEITVQDFFPWHNISAIRYRKS